VRLSVSDQGPGVPLAEREGLFQWFSRPGSEEGTGLGLSIAREIIQAMGGSIEYEDTGSGGATFVLNFAAA
jgi:signal transduction histidine kinase